MRRLAMQDRVAARAVRLVLQDLLHVLLVADVHDAARGETVLLEDVEEDLDRRGV
jgi:hypothetical protein